MSRRLITAIAGAVLLAVLTPVKVHAAPVAVDPDAYAAGSFAVGAAPLGVAMVGAELPIPGFVANSGDGTVTVFTPCMPKSCAPAPFTTITVGGTPTSVVANSDGSQAYVSLASADGVAVITGASTTSTIRLAGTIPVGRRPGGLAIDAQGARVYVANNGGNSVSVIDTASSAVVATIPVGTSPGDAALDPSGATLIVTNNGGNSVSVIDTASRTVVATVPVGRQPWGVDVAPDGDHAFVANYADGTVSAIRLATRSVVGTITVGDNPFGVTAWPTGGTGSVVYVANAGSASVSTIALAAATTAVTWSSRGQTVRGAVPLAAGVEYGIRAVQNRKVRTGSCQQAGTARAVCTVHLPPGLWRVSVTTRLPWQTTAEGNQNRRFVIPPTPSKAASRR